MEKNNKRQDDLKALINKFKNNTEIVEKVESVAGAAANKKSGDDLRVLIARRIVVGLFGNAAKWAIISCATGLFNITESQAGSSADYLETLSEEDVDEMTDDFLEGVGLEEIVDEMFPDDFSADF